MTSSAHSKITPEDNSVPDKVAIVMYSLAKKHYRAYWKIAVDCMMAGWMMREQMIDLGSEFKKAAKQEMESV